jgi:hypothetical protein
MFNDVDHPNVTLAEWQDFIAREKSCKEHPLLDEVIDRSQCCVANWFVPLARGAAVASDALLRRVGTARVWVVQGGGAKLAPIFSCITCIPPP